MSQEVLDKKVRDGYMIEIQHGVFGRFLWMETFGTISRSLLPMEPKAEVKWSTMRKHILT